MKRRRRILLGFTLSLVVSLSSCGGELHGTCFDGGCADDSSLPDSGGDTPCAQIICGEGQECRDGVCLLVDPCRDVTCDLPDEVCDPRDGVCRFGAIDEDGDGYTISDGDCDDTDPSRHPNAPEVCDGEDQDCDLIVDEELPDEDGDGVDTCGAVEGDLPDCDDHNPNRYPGAVERCNLIDDDCDESIHDESGCGPLLYTLSDNRWSYRYLSELWESEDAFPCADASAAFTLNDFCLTCFSSATHWCCVDSEGLARSNSWWTATQGLAELPAPSSVFATRMESALPRTLRYHDGTSWWSFAWAGPPVGSTTASSWRLVLQDWHGNSESDDLEALYSDTPNTPMNWSRIVAEWVDEDETGEAMSWVILQDDGVVYRYTRLASGTDEWAAPGPDPRFALTNAPPVSSIRDAASNCHEDLIVIATELPESTP